MEKTLLEFVVSTTNRKRFYLIRKKNNKRHPPPSMYLTKQIMQKLKSILYAQ